MAITSATFRQGDVYIDYPFEQVMIRYDHAKDKVFRKFYGESEETEIPQNNELFNEAILAGSQTTASQYQAGKKPTR